MPSHVSRSDLLSEWRGLIDQAEAERRALTSGESTRIQEIDRQLEALAAYEVPESQRTAAAVAPDVRVTLPSFSEYRAQGSVPDSAGGYLLPEDVSRAWFDRLRADTVVLAAGVQVFDIEHDTSLPVIGTSAVAAMTAENTEIAASDLAFETRTLRPKKLGALVRASNEWFSDAITSVRELVAQDLLRTMAGTLDVQLLQGTGAGVEITGLRNTLGATTTYMGDNGAILTLAAVLAAIARMETSGAKPGAIFMHPRDWANLKAEKDSQLRYQLSPDPAAPTRKILFGIPVYTSAAISTTETRGTAVGICSYALVVDPARVVVGRRTDTQVVYDTSRYLEYDQVAIRATSRWDQAVLNAGAVEILAGIKAS